MIELFLLMVSVAVHGAASAGQPGAMTSTGTASVAAPSFPAPKQEDAAETAATSSFASPVDSASDQTATAAPSFPSPDDSQSDQTATATAAPLFLSPDDSASDKTAAAAPLFLSPDDAQKPATTAAPLFLAPSDAGKPALQAEPQIPTGRFTIATEVKPILAATRANWIAVRDFNEQDLVYVTHLWSWRCGLLELKIGINGGPAEPWPLPECHLDLGAPNSILQSDGSPYRAFPPGSVQQIEVQLTYDDLSTDQARFNRQGIQIP